ncbi:hypothetical protein D3C78_1275910 [compost metagenome]
MTNACLKLSAFLLQVADVARRAVALAFVGAGLATGADTVPSLKPNRCHRQQGWLP